MTTEMCKNIELIKNSPALEDDLWAQIDNLCSTIETVCGGIQSYLELIDKTSQNSHKLDQIMDYTFQIGTLSDIVKEKIPRDDLIIMSNIIYDLVKTNEKEEKKCQ